MQVFSSCREEQRAAPWAHSTRGDSLRFNAQIGLQPAQLVEHRGERAHELVDRGGVGDMRRRQVLLQAVALGELMNPVARLQHHAAEHAHHTAHRHHAAHVDQRRARRRVGRAALALALRLVRPTGRCVGQRLQPNTHRRL